MNTSVVLFFLHTVVATLIVGGLFAKRPEPVFRSFGVAILLDAIAFIIWTIPVVTEVQNLPQYVSIGTMFFIASLVFLLKAGTEGMNASARRLLLAFGILVGAGIFFTGGLAQFPSTPAFSDAGLFFFNVHPLLQALYILALALTAFPAIEAVVSKFQGGYATLLRYGFIAEVAAGVILITASSAGDALAAYVAGWVIGFVYLILWTTLLFKREAWPN
jgi:hypothetical protein